MSSYKSIYRSGVYWEAVASRAMHTFGQAGAGALTAAAFTGEGIIPFLIVVGVAVVGSILSSISTPGVVLAKAPEEWSAEPQEPEGIEALHRELPGKD